MPTLALLPNLCIYGKTSLHWYYISIGPSVGLLPIMGICIGTRTDLSQCKHTIRAFEFWLPLKYTENDLQMKWSRTLLSSTHCLRSSCRSTSLLHVSFRGLITLATRLPAEEVRQCFNGTFTSFFYEYHCEHFLEFGAGFREGGSSCGFWWKLAK